MKNLSQIPENELIIVKYKGEMTGLIEAGEIASCIAYNEGYNLEFFTAVKDAVQINERELITNLTEMLWTIVNKKDTIFKYIFWERLDSLPIPESCFHFVWCQIA